MNNDDRVYLTAFHEEVTGSKTLITIISKEGNKHKVLIDCGYYQEVEYRHLNYETEFNPEEIDAIVITHNHIDHTGLLPKVVKDGFNGKIYMTIETKELLASYLKDSAMQQEENAKYLRHKYPEDEYKFKTLYGVSDVAPVMQKCVGVNFRTPIEILPGIIITFYENGHILGAGFVLVETEFFSNKPINLLFTGDYRKSNPLFTVPTLPKGLKKKELIIVTESTYGETNREEVKICFEKNMIEAFSNHQNVLIGAFAQARMQELLNRLRIMSEKGLIPEDYEICVDGPLGISTSLKYLSIFHRMHPNAKDFMPANVKFVSPSERCNLLNENGYKILLTTSGMLSNGPAKEYVPMFLKRPDCLIHLCGYAAEETIARNLLDSMDKSYVKIGGKIYQKQATVKATQEFSSHATADELLDLLRQFPKARFAIINHGSATAKETFLQSVRESCPNVKECGLIGRTVMYCIIQRAARGAKYSDIVVKSLPAKLGPSNIKRNSSKKPNSECNLRKGRKSYLPSRKHRR